MPVFSNFQEIFLKELINFTFLAEIRRPISTINVFLKIKSSYKPVLNALDVFM